MAHKFQPKPSLVQHLAINQIYSETTMKGRKYVNRSMDNDRAFNRLPGRCVSRS